jgi:hypothetical protein
VLCLDGDIVWPLLCYLEIVNLVNVLVGRKDIAHDNKVDLLSLWYLDSMESIETG